MHNEMEQMRKRDDFQQAWEHRKQKWQETAEYTLPDDATILHMAELARQQTQAEEATVTPFTAKRHARWIPYAAAACLVIGVAAIGLNHEQQKPDPQANITPTDVEGQTILFMCNNGCTAQEVMLAVNDVIKK